MRTENVNRTLGQSPRICSEPHDYDGSTGRFKSRASRVIMFGMKTQIDPKVDYAFKHVFGREESKPALISLLHAVLQPAAGQGIASLELLNPFNEKTSEGAKLSIVDIKARDESGPQFLIEMQMLAADVFRQRALYYWAALYQEQLHQGENWAALRPTIVVCFVDTPLFSQLDDYHLTFELRERRHQMLFTDQLAVHILELSKFRKELDDLTVASHIASELNPTARTSAVRTIAAPSMSSAVMSHTRT